MPVTMTAGCSSKLNTARVWTAGGTSCTQHSSARACKLWKSNVSEHAYRLLQLQHGGLQAEVGPGNPHEG